MRLDYLTGSLKQILEAVPRTLLIALLIMVLAIALGAALAVIRVKRIRVLNAFARILVAYVRGTPPVVQLLIVYYSLPSAIVFVYENIFGKCMNTYDVPGIISLVVAFVICLSGYQCEVIRSALNSVDYGQMEAGQSVGMTESQTMRRIILPQVLSVAMPGFFTHYMSTIKMMSLGFMLQIVDIMAAAKLYSAVIERYTESYVAAAITYWIIGVTLTFAFNRWERRRKKA